MIQFRCWYCNRRYAVPEQRVGERLRCSCTHPLKIPRRSGGNCRIKTPVDWLVEAVVYGGGGALLGLGLAVLIITRTGGLGLRRYGWAMLAGLTAVGFLAGVLGGERGVNWVGQMIRDREDH